MLQHDTLLDRLASAIVDGKELDWERLEGEISGESEEQLLTTGQAFFNYVNFHTEGREQWCDLRILDKVGEGAYGEVYSAWDPILERRVALKLFRSSSQSSQRRQSSLLAEGRLLARIHHPSVVTVHRADEDKDRVGIVMEFVEGRTLEQALHREGPLQERDAARIGMNLCRALSAIHERGLIHRDVKAQNVMRDREGRVVLMDLGLGIEQELSEMLPAGGTPLYMAPELLEHRPASPQSDLYALGVLLFHLTTGEFPVVGKSLEELRRAHQRGLSIPIEKARARMNRRFRRAVRKALSVDPGDRPGSAEELRLELEKVLTGRKLWKWAVSIVLLVSILLASAFWFRLQTVRTRLELAERQYERGETEAAIAIVESSLSLWPDYPPALASRSFYKAAIGEYSESLADSEKAYHLRDSVGEPERSWIEGIYHNQRLQYHKAKRAFEGVIGFDPDDLVTQRQVVHILNRMGQRPAALSMSRKVVEADLSDVIDRGVHLLLLAAEYPTKALEMAIAAQQETGHPYFSWAQGIALIALKRPRDAFDAVRSLREGNLAFGTRARILTAECQIAAGKIHEGVAELQRDTSIDLGQGFERDAAYKTLLTARLQAWIGDKDEAVDSLNKLTALAEITYSARVLRNAAIVALDLENLDLARKFYSKLESICAQVPSPVCSSFLFQIEAEIALYGGNGVPARQFLEDAKVRWENAGLSRSLARFWIGEGELRRASIELESFIDRIDLVFREDDPLFWVLAHLDLAECYLKLGEHGKARFYLDDFLTMWSEADQSIGEVAKALARARRLKRELP